MLMVHFPERGTASHHRPLLTAGDTEPNDRLANELSYCSAPSLQLCGAGSKPAPIESGPGWQYIC